MTRRNNARAAGIAYLLYIAAAFPSMVLMDRATRGAGLAAKLAGLAQHAADIRLAAILSMIGGFCALVLGVTLWAVTRDQDADLATLGMACRVSEGVIGAASLPATFALLSLATAVGAQAPDPSAAQALAGFVLLQPWNVSATFFAVGSTLFSWLLLKGRMIPSWLAWTGLMGSALLAVGLTLQMAEVMPSLPGQLMWIPVAVFELVLGPWLIIKGVKP